MATPGTTEAPNPNEELVKVFDSEQESEVMVVRGLLESAGIECVSSNLDAPQDILPGVGGVILLVRKEDAEEALRIIQENREAGASGAEQAEIDEEASEKQEPPAQA
jgi:ornithine cyclodeaminase/alanine dehydrogenase-like protein (mu-crystallin family)